jgi:hypothetical protein
MRDSKVHALLALVAAALISIYYWRFTHVSLWTGFSHDDLMNIFFAWREPFLDVIKANLFFRTNVTRPFGALFYASFFHWFGLEALPYRVFCYAVLWLTLPVTYLFVRYATHSREIGVLSVLLHCYHSNLFPLYYGSGCCYDIFAFVFYYSAFAITARARRANRNLSAPECLILAVLFACAVNSKEAAASLPALLLMFEVLHSPPKSITWIWREGRSVLVTGSVGLLYLWARFTGPNNLLDHSAYRPVFALSRYLESTATYLNDLSARAELWTSAGAAMLLGSMALIAALMRRRDLWLAWLLVTVGAAPIAFVQPRGVHAYYIPILGYAMFAAILLVAARKSMMRSKAAVPVAISQAALFLIVYAAMWQWQAKTERHLAVYWEELRGIQFALREFQRHPEWFRPGSRLLIVNDNFPDHEWASTFIASLVGADKSIHVQTLKKLDPKPARERIASYTTIVGLRDGAMVELDPSQVR